MYTKRRRIVVILICVAFLFATFFSLFFIAKEKTHQCTGEDCTICVVIHQVEQVLNNLATDMIMISSRVPAIVMFATMLAGLFGLVLCISLVSQKVRLNN